MRRPQMIRTMGFILAGLVALSIGARPSLKAQQASIVVASGFVGGAFGGAKPADEPAPPPVYLPDPLMTLAQTKTRLKLHDKIPMNFPVDTPLDDVVKYIEQATMDKADFPEGIAIYVDPQGLQDADKTLQSTVVLHLKNLPLETTLDLLLKQLNLTYWVNKDGLMIITAASDDLVTPITMDREILTNLSSLRTEIRALRAEVKALRRGEKDEPSGPNDPGAGRGTVGGMGGGFR